MSEAERSEKRGDSGGEGKGGEGEIEEGREKIGGEREKKRRRKIKRRQENKKGRSCVCMYFTPSTVIYRKVQMIRLLFKTKYQMCLKIVINVDIRLEKEE